MTEPSSPPQPPVAEPCINMVDPRYPKGFAQGDPERQMQPPAHGNAEASEAKAKYTVVQVNGEGAFRVVDDRGFFVALFESGQRAGEYADWMEKGGMRHLRLESALLDKATSDLAAAEAERDQLREQLAAAKDALEKSVELQSHYATLLNGYDGGERMKFTSGQEWIDRLAKLAERAGEAGT